MYHIQWYIHLNQNISRYKKFDLIINCSLALAMCQDHFVNAGSSLKLRRLSQYGIYIHISTSYIYQNKFSSPSQVTRSNTYIINFVTTTCFFFVRLVSLLLTSGYMVCIVLSDCWIYSSILEVVPLVY